MATSHSYEFDFEDLLQASQVYLKIHNLDTNISKEEVTKCVVPTPKGQPGQYKLDHWKLYCLLKKKNKFGLFLLPKSFVEEIDLLVVRETNKRKELLWSKLPLLLSDSDSWVYLTIYGISVCCFKLCLGITKLFHFTNKQSQLHFVIISNVHHHNFMFLVREMSVLYAILSGKEMIHNLMITLIVSH